MRKRLIDVFDDWRTENGLFGYFTGYDVPWTNVSSLTLNFMYFGGRSGGKYISPLVGAMLNVHGELETHSRQELVDIIVNHFQPKWNRIYITTVLEYNPIENYNMVEDELLTIDYGKRIQMNLYKRGTDSTSVAGTTSTEIERNESNSGSDTTKVTGLNIPNTGFRDNNQILKQNLTDITDTQKVTDNNTTTLTRDTEDEESTHEDGTDSHGKKLKRTGNIGVTTTQQLIKSEREIQIDFFTEIVFPDIDKILTLQLY